MSTYLLFGHGSSYNHGAEAIIKTTVRFIRQRDADSRILLSTSFRRHDEQFALPVDGYLERDEHYAGLDKASRMKHLYDALIYKRVIDEIDENTVCLSTGGDNYCYPNWRRWDPIVNTAAARGAKCVLWGCSVEPKLIDADMIAILSKHTLIVTRESISYDALKQRGLTNVCAGVDTAFFLEAETTELPNSFLDGNTVGINLSPLVVRREPTDGCMLRNAYALIDFILNKTDMSVALIPHVVLSMDNDYGMLKQIYDGVQNHERVCLLPEDWSAAQYKYAISRCRYMVSARTHAVIAAYSSCVPTIAIGYSTKASGLAADVGQSYFVLPIGAIMRDDTIISMFKELIRRGDAAKPVFTASQDVVLGIVDALQLKMPAASSLS